MFTSTLLADIYSLEFEEMFVQGQFGTAKTDNVTHTLAYDGSPLEVYFSPSDGAMNEVISEIESATESIHFSIFFTDDDLRDAMLAKASEGITITGVWDRLAAGNAYSEDEALCAAGIPIKIEDCGGKMHNKFMVIDANGSAPRVITGSMNWSGSGDNANDENTLIIHDGGVAQQYLAAYQELYDALGSHTLCTTTASYFNYLPFLMQTDGLSQPTPTPVGTPIPSPTATPIASPTPTSVPQPTANITIVDIFYDGTGSQEPDEYVEIRNDGSTAIQLQGWTLSDEANHVYTFPNFSIQPGQICRIYTSETHPEWCGFNYGSGSAIWNNSGDCAYLRNNNNTLIDMYCY